jgi:MarR family transcriptional regulator, transcriptional regulator for hemolysin
MKIAPVTVPAITRQEVLALMRENGHLYRQLFRRRLKGLAATSAEARALLYLGANQGIVQGRLAELLDVQPITLTRMIDRLEQGGWVERRLHETDRRLRLLFLTPAGKAAVRQILALHDEVDALATAQLTEKDVIALGVGLEHINAVLRTMR